MYPRHRIVKRIRCKVGKLDALIVGGDGVASATICSWYGNPQSKKVMLSRLPTEQACQP
jgi:hypothetical protein